MNDVQLAKYLGWFSLGLGTIELVASRRIARAVGVGNSVVVQAFGAREIATGLTILDQPDMAAAVWGRVAGDMLDAAALVPGLAGRRRGGAGAALLFVAAATVLDVAVASALTARQARALQTAQRTRRRV